MPAGIRTRDMDVSVPPMAPSALDYDAIIRINNEIVTKWKKKYSRQEPCRTNDVGRAYAKHGFEQWSSDKKIKI